MQAQKHEQWSSEFMFLLAAVGSAVGLGNIWRFPYVVGENGGGAFVLVYLGIVVVLGIPLVMTELMIGRKAQTAPVIAISDLSKDTKSAGLWKVLGWSYMFVPLGILTFYTVVAGWTFHYVLGMGMGDFSNLTNSDSADKFDAMLADPWTLIFWMTAAIAVTAYIVAKGIKNGLEKAVKILMPALFGILILLVLYSSFTGDFARSVDFMFNPDFSKINSETILMATGQAFFSLSLGSAAIMVYGSYLPKDVSIPKMAVGVAFADTFVAILAGFAIFPIVFAQGIEPSAGPGLVFVTLPMVFDVMPMGQFVGVMFFLLLAFAAITSTISLLEPMVAYLEQKGVTKRARAAVYTSAGIWVVGVLAALSFNVMKDFKPLGFLPTFAEKTFFDLMDYFSANIFILINMFMIAIFAGWILKRKMVLEEMGMGDSLVFKFWEVLVKIVIPIAVGIIFWNFVTS